MDQFLIKKCKLSEVLPGLNTSAHSVDVKELPGQNSNHNVKKVSVGEKNIDIRSKNRF